MALERVADGVWLLRGDLRGAMNVYFIEDGDGVVQFDAGTKSMRKKTADGGAGARRAEADRPRPRPRRPPRHRALPRRAGLLPPRRSRRRRQRQGGDALLQPLAAGGGAGALDLPDAAAALGRRPGEGGRDGRRGRRGGGLPRPPLPRARAGADRAVAGERPRRARLRRRLPGRLGAAESRCPRARRASPTPPSTGTTRRRSGACGGWRSSNRWSSAPATSGRCAARGCGRRSRPPPRSTERTTGRLLKSSSRRLARRIPAPNSHRFAC